MFLPGNHALTLLLQYIQSADDLNTSRNVSWSFATDILLKLKSNIFSWFSFTRPFAAAKSVSKSCKLKFSWFVRSLDVKMQ